MELAEGQIWECKEPTVFFMKQVIITEITSMHIRIARFENNRKSNGERIINRISLEKNFRYIRHINNSYKANHKNAVVAQR